MALAGVVVGGAIGYLSSRALQDRESEVAARGSARVAQARLLRVADDVSVMVETRRAFDPRSGIPPELDVDDRRVMASELSADEWAEVLRGEAAVEQVLKVSTPRRSMDRRIDPTTCAILDAELSTIVRGAGALGDLAQVDVPPDRLASYSEARC